MWWMILIGITLVLYVISFFIFRYIYHHDVNEKISPFPWSVFLLTSIPIIGFILPLAVINMFQEEYKKEYHKSVSSLNNRLFGKPRYKMTKRELREKNINDVI